MRSRVTTGVVRDFKCDYEISNDRCTEGALLVRVSDGHVCARFQQSGCQGANPA